MRTTTRKARSATTYRLQAVIEVDEDGVYVATCPVLQGCHAQGATFEEALANVRDVIRMCLEELQEGDADVDLLYPEVVGIKSIEVTA